MRDAPDFDLADLRKVDVESFPIRRIGKKRALRVVNGTERPVAERDARRIEKLVIPPAWRNVRISADPRSHIQAVGRDEAGRLQYIYHADWETVRSANKARRLQDLVAALPRLRRAIARDLDAADGRRTLATAARLVDRLCLRAGHEQYAGEESGRGAATLLKKHVRISGDTVLFDFPGKGGKRVELTLADRKIARNLLAALKLPGRRLFKLKGNDGWRSMTANDLNRYLSEIAGCDISAKDFRTLRASALALARFSENSGGTAKARKQLAVQVVREVSVRLVNTPAVVRKSYIYATILDQYLAGSLPSCAAVKPIRGCSRSEALLHQFLAHELN